MFITKPHLILSLICLTLIGCAKVEHNTDVIVAQTQPQWNNPTSQRAGHICPELQDIHFQQQVPFLLQQSRLCEGLLTLAQQGLQPETDDVANAYLDALEHYVQTLREHTQNTNLNNAMAFFLSRRHRVLEKQNDWQTAIRTLNESTPS